MLIEFTIGNHLSFKDKKTLSLKASAIKEFEENTFDAGSYTLLKSAVIYGANSSGKSNLINSLKRMQNIVRGSAQMSSTDKIDVKPFLLNSETESMPSYFEVLVLIEDTRYRYGFEADENIIHSEWLFKRKSKKELLLFIRDKDEIEISKEFEEGKGVAERTRDNALFLSVCDQWNGLISKKIMNWFNLKLYIISGLDHQDDRHITLLLNKSSKTRADINDLIKQLDMGFNEFKVTSSSQNENLVLTNHNKYDIDGNIIGNYWFDLINQESSGTNKIFDIAGYLIAGLYSGSTTFIDELDAKLHPLLTVAIVKLFNSPEHNPKNAQLIFATHDTNLLSYGEFRRDQIYFTEKNQVEETDLYSLVEFKDANGVKPRNDRSFEKDYIYGRYGAIPFIGNFSTLISE